VRSCSSDHPGFVAEPNLDVGGSDAGVTRDLLQNGREAF
jgi:hypothetical protein